MTSYILRRILYMFPTLFLISIIVFIVIQLPPGSWVDSYVAQLQQTGGTVSESQISSLKERYGLGEPVYIQYFKWVKGWPFLDFGVSFEYNQSVFSLIADRLLLSVVIAVSTLLFVYAFSIPVAVYAATHQYSVGDNIVTLAGFLGLSIPNFMLALVLMYVFFQFFGITPGGLFSPEFEGAAWSWGKLIDLSKHIWLPIIVVGTAGTASTIRVLRGTMLDELGRDYVQVARAKGLENWKVVFKHVLRVAINPIISRIIWELPRIVSGATITAVVLSLPILGGMLLTSLQVQDMYLAGTIIFFQSVLVVIGGVISDVLLAVADPRIRYE